MKKTSKNLNDIIENITERKMKFIIVVFTFICIICEFVPDMINVCQLFNYCKIVVFLQPHKEFFTNIALGCLGSAVISYLMIYIQIKVKDNDRKAELKKRFSSIVFEYYVIFYILKNIEVYEDVGKIRGYLKETNNTIKMNIKVLLNSSVNINNNTQQNELYKIIMYKILPITEEIAAFLAALEVYNYEEITNKKCYNEDFYLILMKGIYKKLVLVSKWVGGAIQPPVRLS